MSKAATQYVKSLRTGPDGKRITAMERLVLEALAFDYHDELGYGFRRMAEIAEGLHISVTYCRRIIAALEKKGLVARQATRDRKGFQVSNNYCLPALAVSKTPMQQIEAERKLLYAFRAPMAKQQVMGIAPAKVSGDVEMRRDSVGPGDTLCVGPGETLCVGPRKRIEREKESEPPKPPLPTVESAKTFLGKAEARATANATAKAATVAARDLSRQLGDGGSYSMSSRAGEIMRRDRATESAGMPMEAQLDGEDAAWHAEVCWVTSACDVQNASLMAVILRAMQGCHARIGGSMHAVGKLAVHRYNQYYSTEVVRAWYAEPRRFFRDGLWLRPASWSFDRTWASGYSDRYLDRLRSQDQEIAVN
jgi:hypothetical protein